MAIIQAGKIIPWAAMLLPQLALAVRQVALARQSQFVSHGAGSGIIPAWKPTLPNLHGLVIGSVGQPLIPALKVPENSAYDFLVEMNKTEAHINYTWTMTGVHVGRRHLKAGAVVADLSCAMSSYTYGDMSFRAEGVDDEEILRIRSSSGLLGRMLSRRRSFLVMPPGTSSKEGALFTVTRNALGRGLFWQREVYWIYRGTEAVENAAYYCVGSYDGTTWKVYYSKADFEKYRGTLADIVRVNSSETVGGGRRPLSVKVAEGVDSAVMLALATVINIVNR